MYPDGTFKPNQPITRQEMARIIAGFLDCRAQFGTVLLRLRDLENTEH